MDEKDDAGRARLENVGDVMVFVVETADVYPRQSKHIHGAIKAGIETAAEPKVVVDLSNVKFVCSAFIGEFIALHKLAEKRAGGLKICVTDEHIAYTMELLRLNEIIEIGSDAQQLAASF